MSTDRVRFLRYLQAEKLGPAKHWPDSIRRLLFGKTSLKNQERFKIVVFFLVNGISPDLIRRRWVPLYDFDSSALRHIEYIIEKYPSSDWMAWNVSEGRSM